MILIHGLGADSAFWYTNIVRYLNSDFRLTSYDLRGHGYSGAPPEGYTTADMASDLRSLLDYLDIAEADLVGHSFGGAIALHFAVLSPDRVASLTVADGLIRAAQPVVRLKDWPYWETWKSTLDLPDYVTGEEEPEQLLEILARLRLQGPPNSGAYVAPSVPFTGWSGGVRSARKWLTLLETTTARSDFKSVAGMTLTRISEIWQPAVAIYGEYSFCLPSCDALAHALRRCEVIVIPAVGHFHPIVKARIFSEQCRQFLSRSPALRG